MLRGMDAAIFRDLSEAMQMSWLAFAHTGDPRSAATSTWQEYDSSTRMSMRLDSNCVAVSDPAGYARHPLRDPALSA
ncbi:MAG: hypothetical protein JWP41_563 [Ramlibacter sp.]|nr:hypothetical protein [Ramlibacter sp.]